MSEVEEISRVDALRLSIKFALAREINRLDIGDKEERDINLVLTDAIHKIDELEKKEKTPLTSSSSYDCDNV